MSTLLERAAKVAEGLTWDGVGMTLYMQISKTELNGVSIIERYHTPWSIFEPTTTTHFVGNQYPIHTYVPGGGMDSDGYCEEGWGNPFFPEETDGIDCYTWSAAFVMAMTRTEVNSKEDCIEFAQELEHLGVVFHPDTPFADYIHLETGLPTFTIFDAMRLDKVLAMAFAVAERDGFDLYEVMNPNKLA